MEYKIPESKFWQADGKLCSEIRGRMVASVDSEQMKINQFSENGYS